MGIIIAIIVISGNIPVEATRLLAKVIQPRAKPLTAGNILTELIRTILITIMAMDLLPRDITLLRGLRVIGLITAAGSGAIRIVRQHLPLMDIVRTIIEVVHGITIKANFILHADNALRFRQLTF